MDQSAPNGAAGEVATTSGSNGMSQKELRELRRKKIMERGRDRLAFITGEVKTLPPTAAGSNPGETGLKTLADPGELPVSDFTLAGVQFAGIRVPVVSVWKWSEDSDCSIRIFNLLGSLFINCDCHDGIHSLREPIALAGCNRQILADVLLQN